MSKKNHSSNINATISISTLTKGLLIGGIILFLMSYLDFKQVPYLKVISSFLESILNNIGLTCISAGLVSIVVEISSIQNVINDSIKRIVSDDFPFESLSRERLDDIHKQIVVNRSANEKMNISYLNNSVYALEEELLNASDGLYYEYNKARFVITHDKKKEMFLKTAEFDYRIVNRFGIDNKVSFSISLIHPSDDITEADLKKMIEITKFCISKGDKKSREEKEDLTDVANDYLNIVAVEKQAHSLYKYEVKFLYPLTKCMYNKIEIIYKYLVPDYDIVQSYKLNYPSKVLEHTLIFDKCDEVWELSGDAYTAFFFPPTDREYEIVQSVANVMRINFRDWAITGAGYMVTFLKK